MEPRRGDKDLRDSSVAPPGLRVIVFVFQGLRFGLRPALHPWLPSDAPPGLQTTRTMPGLNGASCRGGSELAILGATRTKRCDL